jgi:hypothetical protein
LPFGPSRTFERSSASRRYAALDRTGLSVMTTVSINYSAAKTLFPELRAKLRYGGAWIIRFIFFTEVRR